jgi:hypothetical protein
VIILDTNVLSEIVRANPDDRVMSWIDGRDPETVYTTTVTVAELLYGVERLPAGRRKMSLAVKIDTLLGTGFEGRVLSFDLAASLRYARLAAHRAGIGRPVQMGDGMIAGIALSQGDCSVATRNTTDFADIGLDLINPWDDA